MKKLHEQSETGCCPRFDPAPWDGKAFEWSGKRFIKDRVFTLFYMPINFGQVVSRMIAKAENSGAAVTDQMGLSDHTSKWNMDLYLAVDKEVPGAENVTMNGKFLSKVYEGPFKDTGKWCKDLGNYAKEKGLSIKKMFMWYTTCPKCEKVYGKNYVVLLAEI